VADKTGIEWTDATWNPVRGCSRISEGCRHCYAETMAARFSGPGQPYEGLAKRGTSTGWHAKWTGEVRMVPEHLADPLRWRKPRRIFVNSMSDLFHEALTNEQIAAVFGVMAAAPRHTFQVLTKRAERMRDWFRWVAGERLPLRTIQYSPRLVCAVAAKDHGVDVGSVAEPRSWPLPNVWLGVSVENQLAADTRIKHLLATPAAIRFLSCEPLLGPIQLGCEVAGEFEFFEHGLGAGRLGWVDWVIAGCESGRGARPAQVDWYRSLRDQCAAAGVPFFLKQAVRTDDEAVGFGAGSERKAGGVVGLPLLDGNYHAAFPEAR
jgi:protein gp37